MPVSPPFCLPSWHVAQAPHATGHASAAVTLTGKNNIEAISAEASSATWGPAFGLTYCPKWTAHIGCHVIAPGAYWSQPARPWSETQVSASRHGPGWEAAAWHCPNSRSKPAWSPRPVTTAAQLP